jgi:RES domain-containing protein
VSLSAWRLVRAERVGDAFSGEGARLHGGRWNAPGLPVVYCAGNRSLAALEVLVHLPRAMRGAEFVLFRVEFEERHVMRLPSEQLPERWWVTPPPPKVQALGDDWLRAGRAPVLRVPSVLVPEEPNYLFNPGHATFASFAPVRERAFRFDPRLG